MTILPLGAALAGVVLSQPPPTPPDQIFQNARIWTGVPGRPFAEAMAVRGDRLVAVGTTAAIQRRRGPATLVTDLDA